MNGLVPNPKITKMKKIRFQRIIMKKKTITSLRKMNLWKPAQVVE